MDRNFFNSKNSEIFPSGYYTTPNKNKESESKEGQTEINLRNKLDNAFTDLETLRKALKDIRKNNDNIITNNNGNNKSKNKEKYDFFSDERYNNVLNQIKESNQDKNKPNKINSVSREKIAKNNSFAVFKSNQNNFNKETHEQHSKILLNSLKIC